MLEIIDKAIDVEQRDVTIFAAGSLSQAFKKIAADLEKAHGISIRAEFGSTARMAMLIQEGERCDIFVSADMETPLSLVDAGYSDSVFPFVRNDTVAVVRRDLDVTDQNLIDFIESYTCQGIGISDPNTQPCGKNALRAISTIVGHDTLDNKIRIVTGGLGKKAEKAAGERSDYTIALEKIGLLMVFRTTAKKVCEQSSLAEIIELPASMQTTAQYGFTEMRNAASASKMVVEYLCSDSASSVLEAYGFR